MLAERIDLTDTTAEPDVETSSRPPELMLDDLLAWAEAMLGSSVTTSDRSGSNDASLVLELRDSDGGRWFLKYPRDRKRFEREVRAYETFLHSFGDLVPSLVAFDEQHQCLLVSAVPGGVARDSQRATDPQVYRAAGAWLARLHASAPPVSAPELALGEQFTGHRESLIENAGDLLERAEINYLIRATTEVPEPAEAVIVPCHRDYSPRNWMLDEHGVLRVIDFGLSELDVAVRDFSRLAHRGWPARPHLKKAFLDGYGRPLDEAEDRQLEAFVVLSIVRVMVRAYNRSDVTALRRERRVLARFEAAAASR